MPNYLHPGVYVEEIPSGSKPIEGVGTSTAAFVGYATKGPIGEPTLIQKWDDYENIYGGVRDLRRSTQGDPMGLSVAAFFLNGGTKAYIVRIVDSTALKATGYVDHPGNIGGKALMFTAANEGAWANKLVVKLEVNKLGNGSYDVLVGEESTNSRGNITFTPEESFVGVSLDVNDALYIKEVVNANSELVKVAEAGSLTNVVSDQYLGTSTSGDLTGVSLDFLVLSAADRKMKITVDKETEQTITLDQKNFTDLPSLAAHISGKVQKIDAGKECYAKFSCEVLDNKKLVLTSGTRESSSSVQIDHSFGIAINLKLGVELYEGSSTSGDLGGGFSLMLSDRTSFPDTESRSLQGTVDGKPFEPFDMGTSGLGDIIAVAAKIDGISGLSCVDVSGGNKLKLTSDTNRSTSSVVIQSDFGIAPTLKLGVDSGGSEVTGQRSHNDSLGMDSRIELTGQEHADSVVPKDRLDNGADGGQPLLGDYTQVFTQFIKYRDINIICLPGQHWSPDSSGNPVVQAAIGHAERMKNRMVIVDPPPSHELSNEKMVNDMGLPSQTYCVTYYPWVKSANRFYHAERAPGLPKNVLVPPSGYAAGMWAKIDSKRGVWKAAAGTETGLLGLSGLEYQVDDGDQDSLNPWGVNCLRRMPGAGSVIWGARTLATKADPEWRYVPVRRTAIMIEQSIYQGIQWAVFEPNKHILWSALRANIGNFMNGLFRAGAFQGEKASDAYFVRCGLGDTMTQGDIDAGRVITVVGFAPLKPAEFVIVRIQQKVNQQ